MASEDTIPKLDRAALIRRAADDPNVRAAWNADDDLESLTARIIDAVIPAIAAVWQPDGHIPVPRELLGKLIQSAESHHATAEARGHDTGAGTIAGYLAEARALLAARPRPDDETETQT